MHANRSSRAQKAKPKRAGANIGDQTEKPLCVRYDELIRLRRAVLEAESAGSTRDSLSRPTDCNVRQPKAYYAPRRFREKVSDGSSPNISR